MTGMLDAPVRVTEITLDGGGVGLSGLLAEPATTSPRAVILALHGGGLRAAYFHGTAQPRLSLLTLGAELGFTVLAIDRPGYGASAAQLPHGMSVAAQSRTLHAALESFSAGRDIGAGVFVVAHSYGGKVALRMAADDKDTALVGLDISGCGRSYAVDVAQHLAPRAAADDSAAPAARTTWQLHWGPARLYPPGTFVAERLPLAPMPEAEVAEAEAWPEQFAGIAARVTVPVRFTFAEYERWWRHDRAAADALRAAFVAAPEPVVTGQRNAGHNISLGLAAPSYHMRAIAFAKDCLLEREQALLRV